MDGFSINLWAFFAYIGMEPATACGSFSWIILKVQVGIPEDFQDVILVVSPVMESGSRIPSYISDGFYAAFRQTHAVIC